MRKPPRTRTFREAGATITLVDAGTHHELRIGRVPILTSALLGTERAFGRLVPPRASRVVVGGLGFGATLAGVLETVGKGAEVVVVEGTRSCKSPPAVNPPVPAVPPAARCRHCRQIPV